MQQHLQRLDGVAKAEVSLRDGHVAVYPKPDASLDPSHILKATYDSGVTVAEMDITGSGTVEESGGELTLRLNNQQSFVITSNTLSEKLRAQAGTNQKVFIRGRLYQKPPGNGKQKEPPTQLKLEVLEIQEGP